MEITHITHFEVTKNRILSILSAFFHMMCFIVPNKNTSTNSYYTTETQTEKRAKDSFSNILRALQVRATARQDRIEKEKERKFTLLEIQVHLAFTSQLSTW